MPHLPNRLARRRLLATTVLPGGALVSPRLGRWAVAQAGRPAAVRDPVDGRTGVMTVGHGELPGAPLHQTELDVEA